jgi:sulfite reductase alpha subunit-like flavoprotein
VLSELHVAFSRAQEHKIYVQTLIARDQDSKKIAKLLVDQGGYVYVCGATAMGHDVHEALVHVLKSHKGMNEAQANEHLKTLQTKGRYVQELWSQ